MISLKKTEIMVRENTKRLSERVGRSMDPFSYYMEIVRIHGSSDRFKKNDITSYRRFRGVRKIHGSFFLLYGDRKDPWIFRTLQKRKILRHIVNLGASGRSMDPFLVRVDLRRIHGSSNLSKNKLICEKLNEIVTCS